MATRDTLTESALDVFLSAACCVCAADGRLSSRELAVVAAALRAVGVRMSEQDLRNRIQARTVEIHKQGLDGSVANVARAIRDTTNSRLQELIHGTLPSLLQADGARDTRENRVARIILQACDATQPAPTAPREAPAPQSPAGTSSVPVWLVPAVAGACVLVAVIFTAWVFRFTNKANQAAADGRLAHAVTSAQGWIDGTSRADADVVEQQLLKALADEDVTDKTAGEIVMKRLRAQRDALEEQRQIAEGERAAAAAKQDGERAARTILDDAHRRIGDKQVPEAIDALRKYVSHPHATSVDSARVMLAEAEAAISEDGALASLEAMSDADFEQASNTGEISDGAVSHPVLREIRVQTVRRVVATAKQRRVITPVPLSTHGYPREADQAALRIEATARGARHVDFHPAKRVTVARYLREFYRLNKDDPYFGVDLSRSRGLPETLGAVATPAIQAVEDRQWVKKGCLKWAQLHACEAVFGSLYHGKPDGIAYLLRLGFPLHDNAFPMKVRDQSNTVPNDYRPLYADTPFVPRDPEAKLRYFLTWVVDDGVLEAGRPVPGGQQLDLEAGGIGDLFRILLTREVGSQVVIIGGVRPLPEEYQRFVKRTLEDFEFGNIELRETRGMPPGKEVSSRISDLEVFSYRTTRGGSEGLVFPDRNLRQQFLDSIHDYYKTLEVQVDPPHLGRNPIPGVAPDPDEHKNFARRPAYSPLVLEALRPREIEFPEPASLGLASVRGALIAGKYQQGFTRLVDAFQRNEEWPAKGEDAAGLREYLFLHDTLINCSDDLDKTLTKAVLMSRSVRPLLGELCDGISAEEVRAQTGRDLEAWFQLVENAHARCRVRQFFDAPSARTRREWLLLTGGVRGLPSTDFMASKLRERAALLAEDPDALRIRAGKVDVDRKR